MLTEKTKNFIERVASRMQGDVSIEEPNSYNIDEIKGLLKDMGCVIEYDADDNYYCNKVINLKFSDFTDDPIEKEGAMSKNEKMKILFHEIWHFISEEIHPQDDDSESKPIEYAPISVNYKEATANYFMRAMIFPMETFVKSIIENISKDGMCNVFNVAKKFNTDYVDVIARGNDLDLWNAKGGI